MVKHWSRAWWMAQVWDGALLWSSSCHFPWCWSLERLKLYDVNEMSGWWMEIWKNKCMKVWVWWMKWRAWKMRKILEKFECVVLCFSFNLKVEWEKMDEWKVSKYQKHRKFPVLIVRIAYATIGKVCEVKKGWWGWVKIITNIQWVGWCLVSIIKV